ncbi:RNA polymerase factor sigma-54 [Paenochrobactrum pullorum]|uniref:RNA polymerase factor sigma-54 n=1 Tax=Paenochrobactrum pullorum TaxID=1324351 RepID=UPI0035BBE1C1
MLLSENIFQESRRFDCDCMKAGVKLYTSQQQTQTLAPQMIQSVQVLQYGYDELQSYIIDQVERNPLLELAPSKSAMPKMNNAPFIRKGTLSGSGSLRSIEETHSVSVSLYDYLQQQVMASFDEPSDQLIASEIVYSIEPDGYLRRPCEEIIEQFQTSQHEFQRILKCIQGFEPVGVGARNLAECLYIQLQDKEQVTKSMQILLDNLTLLANRHMPRLAKLCGVSQDEILGMVHKIRALNPKPGLCFDATPAINIVPDAFIRVNNNKEIIVELNTQALPRVLVDRVYASRIKDVGLDEDEKQFIRDCMQSAGWLTRSLDQRARTILKVMTFIARYQRDFFMSGNGLLRPLTMREVAEAIDMHESTISRTVAHKYIMTDRGLFEMKYFFSKAIAAGAGEDDLSAKTIQQKIKQLIDGETVKTILSDDAIAERLKADGIEIARRTVAKYRELMKIASSSQRRWQKKQRGN